MSYVPFGVAFSLGAIQLLDVYFFVSVITGTTRIFVDVEKLAMLTAMVPRR